MLLLLSIFILSCSLHAATWYSASDGSSTNGSYSLPWGVEYAVGNPSNPYLAAGDTVIFKNGSYFCTNKNTSWGLTNILQFVKSGTAEAKIIYQPETLWGFGVDGGLALLSASNIVIKGLRIFNTINTRAATNVFSPPGIVENTHGNELLHNLIENCGHPGIASWSDTKGKKIQGNIIRFAGYDDWSAGYNGANRGSGMYLQNDDDSSEALIEGNISYYNYTTAMKAYGNADIWGFRFTRNINTKNAEAGIFYHNDNYGSDGVIVTDNYLWENGTGVRIGYPLGNGGHSNAVVSWNYVVESGGSKPFYQVDGWRNCIWTNNLGVNLTQRYVWTLEDSGEVNGDAASHTINGNTYFAVTNVGPFHGGPFSVLGTAKTLPEWQGMGYDTAGSYTDGRPTEEVHYVFNPSSDSDFVHVAVFNWPTNTTTSVDLSGYFTTGETLEIYDAQNVPTAYTNIVYGGGSVPLNLTLTNRAEMLGVFSQRSDSWNGFDTRFRAFVIHRTASSRHTHSIGSGTLGSSTQ